MNWKLIVAVSAALVSGTLDAQTPGDDSPQTGAGHAAEDALADYVAQWQKTIQPDEHHAALVSFTGTWTRSYHYLLNPEADEDTRLERKMILGGRFLWEEEYSSVDQIIGGYAVEGYNKTTGEYERVFWHDLGTEISKWRGHWDTKGGDFTYRGRFLEPVMKVWLETKLVARVVSPDRISTRSMKFFGLSSIGSSLYSLPYRKTAEPSAEVCTT